MPTRSSLENAPSSARSCARAGSSEEERTAMAKYIGKEMSRVDGVAKVTGKAKYAAEFKVPNLAYGFIVQGSVARGTIAAIDTTEAERAPGVIKILTHLNAPKLGPNPGGEDS